MKIANNSKRFYENTKLLSVLENEITAGRKLSDIEKILTGNELLVVNSSGTLPSSFRGRKEGASEKFEVRLASFRGQQVTDLSRWKAIVLGKGDWSIPTEKRGAAPKLRIGDDVDFGESLKAKVTHVDHEFDRLIEIKFESEELESKLYKLGRPIQYSYLNEPLKVWDQQTIFSGPPISVEAPSAGFNFSWQQVFNLKKKGVEFVSVIHSAGLSSTGLEALDKKLPFNEFYKVSTQAADAINKAKSQGRPIIGLGTSAVRAVESANFKGSIKAQEGYTSLKLGTDQKPKIVNGLITGMHEDGTSHLELLSSFCSRKILGDAYEMAKARDFRWHEYGDLAFLKCSAA